MLKMTEMVKLYESQDKYCVNYFLIRVSCYWLDFYSFTWVKPKLGLNAHKKGGHFLLKILSTNQFLNMLFYNLTTYPVDNWIEQRRTYHKI